jgi:hypothetical protein
MAKPKPNQTIPHPKPTILDPRLLVTLSIAVMTVVHFAKVSALYPRVVISLLAKGLENFLFAILTLPLVYGLEITTCYYKGLLWVICQA